MQQDPLALPTSPLVFWPFAGSALELSADGELCAAVCGVMLSDSDGYEPHLAIVHLASGRQSHFHLGGSMRQYRSLQWVKDSTAVLVSDFTGHSQLFDLAG